MFKIALKGIMARKGRLLLTSLAVILGTSFLAGTYIFSDTLDEVVQRSVRRRVRRHRRLRAFVGRHRGRLRQRRAPANPGFPDSRGREGARRQDRGAATCSGFARVIGKDGKPVGTEGNGPQLRIVDRRRGRDVLEDQRGPIAGQRRRGRPRRSSADEADYKLGDTVKVVAQGGSREFTLVGIARYGDVSSPGGATFALFDLPTAQ